MKRLVSLTATVIAVASTLTGCGGSSSSLRTCIPITPWSTPDTPKDASGAAQIISEDPAGIGATFSDFYAVKDPESTGQFLAARVVIGGVEQGIGVWFVPAGTHLFSAVDTVAQAATQGVMYNQGTSDNAGAGIAPKCVTGEVTG